MANIGYAYNANAVPSSGYTPLPAGEYEMEIVETDYDVNAKGTGMVLKCRAQIVGGDYDGRPFYINYNLEHADPQTMEIGQRDFAGLRRATGVLSPNDTSELHHHAFRARVDVAMVGVELRNSIAAIAPEDDAPKWTPEQRFLFDLEGELYKMVALAETVETILVQVAVTLQRVNPPKAAALDYAATNLSDLIGELSERYHEVRFPSPDNEPLAA